MEVKPQITELIMTMFGVCGRRGRRGHPEEDLFSQLLLFHQNGVGEVRLGVGGGRLGWERKDRKNGKVELNRK